MQSHALVDVTAAGVSAAARLRRALSLFSGCGALELGLLERRVPITYCESCLAAVQILRSRMSDGALTGAPVHTYVRKLQAADIPSDVEDISQDISIARQNCGFEASSAARPRVDAARPQGWPTTPSSAFPSDSIGADHLQSSCCCCLVVPCRRILPPEFWTCD